MSGMSSRFTNAGYTVPKFMIDVDGKKVIEHIVELYPKDSDFLFIINENHAKDRELCEFLDKLDLDQVEICCVPVHKKGPVFSVNTFDHHIDDDEQVIVNYCDFSMDWDYSNFEKFVNETECDGCVVCYTGFHPHMLGGDNYAFCKVDEDNNIIEIREKQPFTDNKMSEYASTGTYYFKKGSYVKKYFRELMEKEITINGEYYVSMIYNLLTEDGLKSMVYEVPHMLQWGTPLDLSEYQQWSNYYNKVIEGQKELTINNCVTALPMAGWGSRFAKEGYMVPKPCIQVNGHYMVDRALKCLPKTNASSGLTLNFDTTQNFFITLSSGSNTLAQPSTEASNIGQTGVIIFIQPSSGSAGTVSLGTDYETVGGSGLTLSSTNSAYDVVPYMIKADNSILLGSPSLAFS